MFGTAALLILAICLFAYTIARARLVGMVRADGVRSHSLPGYHGVFVALWTGLPSLLLILVWVLLQEAVVQQFILWNLPAQEVQSRSPSEIDLLIAEIKSVASGQIFGEPADYVRAAAERYEAWMALSRWAMLAAAAALAILGLLLARARISPEFRARHGVERIISTLMIVCSTIAILTTLGIVVSLLFEAMRFFSRVPVTEFLFGTNWDPQIPLREDQVAAAGAFGAIPVFVGTILIAGIAMLVAVPIGLWSAIFLSEYAGRRARATIKPLLEILAGVPTVVYGFFAVLVVAPAMRDLGAMLGLAVAPNSALAAGAVMGIMIIPFVSSLSDDALGAVPQAMRDGSYALGATQAETIRQVLLPAALPGIVGGILLAVSRAIGETMIVVMAAGLIAKMTANPLDAVTTVTVQIVTLLIGDTAFDNPKTLAAFALGLTLFLATLGLNVLALHIVQKYREKYD